jgi:ribonuclease P protein subunit RPR2
LRAPRAQQKALAKSRVRILLAKAIETAKEDPELAQRQAAIARRIILRYNIRLPYSEKRLFCHGCKRLLIPGSNARVRLGYRPKAVKITCLECGHVYRKILQVDKGGVASAAAVERRR